MSEKLQPINLEILRSIWETKNRLKEVYREIEDKAAAKSVQVIFDQNDIA